MTSESVQASPVTSQHEIPWPPGNAGHLAQYIYGAAPRPVREVAIVGALGLLAGICGRQWQFSDTGLNVYMILVARSGIGKEAMHQGISTLISAVQVQEPRVRQFVSYNNMASGPALQKACAAQASFVHLAGEFGHVFASLTTAKPDSVQAGLRKTMLDLYPKSSAGSIAGGINYSNKDNNVDSIAAVAYSMIGDTTPGTLFDAITPEAMSDGFMSRFTIVQYHGDRPDKNLTPRKPWPELVTYVAGLVNYACMLETRSTFQLVVADTEGKALLDWLDVECDKRIRGELDEAKRQMWNRAGMKALRIAGLLAVAENCCAPVITTVEARWAITLVLRDIGTFELRLVTGGIGNSDDSRERMLVQVIKDFLILLPDEVPQFARQWEAMRKDCVIPRKYLQLKVQNLALFQKHPLGFTKALESTLKTLMDNGLQQEIPKDELVKKYSFHGKAYRTLALNDAGTGPK